MPHALFASVEEMLAPNNLSELTGVSVKDVRPVSADSIGIGHSGSHIQGVETNQSTGPRYILKRISPERDFIMRASNDRSGREVALWQFGLMDQLPLGNTRP